MTFFNFTYQYSIILYFYINWMSINFSCRKIKKDQLRISISFSCHTIINVVCIWKKDVICKIDSMQNNTRCEYNIENVPCFPICFFLCKNVSNFFPLYYYSIFFYIYIISSNFKIIFLCIVTILSICF